MAGKLEGIDVESFPDDERDSALGILRAGFAALAAEPEPEEDETTSAIDRKLGQVVYTRHGSHDQSSHGSWSVASGLRRDGDGNPGQQVRDIVAGSTGADDGFSVNVSTGESPTTGFMVGGEGIPEQAIPSGEDEAEATQAFIENNRKALSKEGVHLGGWRRPRDMSLVLDASRQVTDEGEAARLAAQRNEDAVFDLDTFEAIPTSELQDR